MVPEWERGLMVPTTNHPFCARIVSPEDSLSMIWRRSSSDSSSRMRTSASAALSSSRYSMLPLLIDRTSRPSAKPTVPLSSVLVPTRWLSRVRRLKFMDSRLAPTWSAKRRTSVVLPVPLGPITSTKRPAL